MRWQQALGCVAMMATAGSAAPLVSYSFENGLATWDKVGNGAPLAVQTKVAHEGSALEAKYTIDAQNPVGGAGVLVAPRLAEAKSIKFRLRTSAPVVIAVAFKENDGSQYQSLLTSPADTWSDADLSLDRFRLAPNTKDENGMLDLDQVNWVGVMDVTKVMPQIKVPDGERTLWLDDLSIDSERALTAYSPDGQLPFVLDNFAGGFVPWVAFDGALSLDKQDGALIWQYQGDKPEGTSNYIFSVLGPLPAKGPTHLLVTLSATRATQLFIVLQEEAREGRDQSRYSTVIGVPASPEFKTYTLPLKEFRLVTGDNGADDNNRLDLDQVGQLVIGDLEVLNGQQPGSNKVFIDEIQLFAAKN
ncbi:MAG: hypothetical protein HZB16_00655 [Armatimonadetes bacterium]|nr:hypothetical protein [Armatimonadota bacterium]